MDADRGVFTFYTNRASRKGREMDANPRVGLVFHWDHMERQIRVEGRAVKTSDEVSDAYFKTRSLARQLGAWSSDQSEPIASRGELVEKVKKTVERFGVDPDNQPSVEESVGLVGRPPHWGGYHVHAHAVEVWAGEGGRIHDRAVWRRELSPSGSSGPMLAFNATDWTSTRLQP